MTHDEIVRAFDKLTRKAWPANGDEVIVNGDEWDGQLVMKASDVLAIIGQIVRYLEREPIVL